MNGTRFSISAEMKDTLRLKQPSFATAIEALAFFAAFSAAASCGRRPNASAPLGDAVRVRDVNEIRY